MRNVKNILSLSSPPRIKTFWDKLQRGSILLTLLLSMFFLMPAISFASTTSKPIPAEQAFQFQVQFDKKNDDSFALKWQMAPDHYLYQESLQVKLDNKPVKLTLPPAIFKKGIDHGDEAIYDGELNLNVPFGQAKHITQLTVRYQGCSKEGFCYPPTTKKYKVDMTRQQLTLINSPHAKNSILNSFLTDQSHTKHALGSERFAVSLLIFFGLGILLAFTPCVLPMVPILVSIIAGHKKRAATASKKSIFSLCLAYVLGVAGTYALVGVLAAMFGGSLQVWLQKPVFILMGAAIFILLALSLFGLFELYMFKGAQNAIASWTRHLKGGSHIGVFAMGVLSVLLISPCTTAPLIGVLLYIGQSGNILLGAAALFVMGLGMGMPLLMVGMSADKWLPRRGPWMEWVKKFFGVLMIGMALWMVGRVGVFGASHSVSQQFMSVASLQDFDKLRNESAQSGRPILLDFYADWCESCVVMDKNVFNNHAVVDALSPFTMLRIDLTANTPMDELLMKHFNVIAPPTVLFFDSQGTEVDSKRIVGEVDADEFIQRVDTFMSAGCDKNATC